ncbi:hypothetical protein nbrc107696_40880 [Gordonia spumicola]|uniref:Uncharacterized protein n=1 Tax=Gordonia spumicola TaxID=589161 RepID=A0A7I9VEJ3_9ACTN|nr:hypothetical protein nbrc107696_40880 [Gordonia spumicola]
MAAPSHREAGDAAVVAVPSSPEPQASTVIITAAPDIAAAAPRIILFMSSMKRRGDVRVRHFADARRMFE